MRNCKTGFLKNEGIIFILFLFTMTVVLLGCEAKDSVVLPTENESLVDTIMEESDATLRARLGIKEGQKLTDEIELVNEGKVVVVDATVQIPDIEDVHVYSMERNPICASEEETLLQSLFPSGVISIFEDNLSELHKTELMSDFGIACFDEHAESSDGMVYSNGDVEIGGFASYEALYLHSYHVEEFGHLYEAVFVYRNEGDDGECVVYVDSVEAIEEFYPEYAGELSVDDISNYAINSEAYKNEFRSLSEDDLEVEDWFSKEDAEEQFQKILACFQIEEDCFELRSLYLCQNMGSEKELLGKMGYCYREAETDMDIASAWKYLPENVTQNYPQNNEFQILLDGRGYRSIRVVRRNQERELQGNYQNVIAVNVLPDVFREVLAKELDWSRLKLGNNVSTVTFQELALCYYYVQNEQEQKQYSYVPAWVLVSRNGVRSVQCAVLINALDGSLISISYGE